jgi:murein DD-endopeptidase MepM/ murein hydrolase activator NlpD
MPRALIKFANFGLLAAIVFSGQSIAYAVVTWQPAKPVNGSPVLFQVSADSATRAISGTWLGHEVTLARVGTGKLWYALAGVPLETAPGTYDLNLTETRADGKTLRVVQTIKVGRAVYPKITVRVAKQYTQPNPEQVKEAQADKGVKQKTFGALTPEKLWSGPFVPPASVGISDVFGTARVFNQEVRSRHQGLDYAAPTGTPVHAVNRGTVILARPLYFEGNCVVVDHGQGLLSLYLHLSEFRVKEGDEVESGQLIGLSGGSGRASGPHLHLAIRWQGVYLNPAILMKLKIP